MPFLFLLLLLFLFLFILTVVRVIFRKLSMAFSESATGTAERSGHMGHTHNCQNYTRVNVYW